MVKDSVTISSHRERSPSFPLIPLEVALKRLLAFESHFKRSPARANSIGAAWGLDARQYVDRITAALRYFGLLEYHGAGKDRQIFVSAEGRKFLRAQQQEVKQQLIREAALRPKKINLFWDEWGDDRPSDEVCLDELMFTHRFTEAGAKAFLKVYDETIAFAELSKPDRRNVEHEHDDADDFSEESPGGNIERPDANLRDHGRVAKGHGNAGMKEDVFALTEGDVVLRWPKLLSPESLEDLKAWTAIVFRKIEREIAANELLNTSVHGAMATRYSDDEEGRAAQERDSELEEH